MIGIGVTTRNRVEQLDETLRSIIKYRPPNSHISIYIDGCFASVEAFGEWDWLPDDITMIYGEENRGIAYAKNRLISHLYDTSTDLFLFDDDTRPTGPDWWKPYVESDQPHLMYQFEKSPGHWAICEQGRDDNHRWFDKARGCMLYVHWDALNTVGGMSLAFGKHGGEHEDWSLRIHEAGLTDHPFADVVDPSIYCADEDRANISSVNYRENQHWRLIDRSRLSQYQDVDYSIMTHIPVLVPRRADNGWRDDLWAFIREQYWAPLDNFRVVEGEHTDGPFNRGAAINSAARDAGNWQYAIIADGDAWVPRESLRRAVEKSAESGRMVAAFDTVYELDRETTVGLIGGEGLFGLDHTKTDRVRTDPLQTQSLMLVVPRTVFESVRGFDERFIGWGGDDNAFWKAVQVLTGEPLRIPGPAYHLWHPSGAPENKSADPNYVANWNLWRRYSQTRTPDAMRALLDEA